MHKTSLYLALILCSLRLQASQLTVVVAVDGLENTVLQQLQPYWPQGGLRLLSEEAYSVTVPFNHRLYGGEESVATLLTGCYPSQHGICANEVFSRTTRQPDNIFLNDRHLGIGTSDSYAADALLAPTVTDRLRLAGNTYSRVYAIGLRPSTTVVLAGHAANACCWAQPLPQSDSLRWVSTSYYKEGLPAAADRVLFTVPNRNMAVVNLALAVQKEKHLGQYSYHDVLLLEMTVLPPEAVAKQPAAEPVDMYLHLNRELGTLFDQLSERVGADNLRIVVMGIPRALSSPVDLPEWNLPARSFSLDRAMALTSTYLMALYGHERWIEGGDSQAVYLNHTAIEQHHLSLDTLRRQVADFLMQFEGVRLACPAEQAYLHPDMLRSVTKRFVGDVVYLLQPDYEPLSPTTRVPVFLYPAPSPAPVITEAVTLAPYIL